MWFICPLDLLTESLYEMRSTLRQHVISMACILPWRMDVTRECISRILELREILLSYQTCLNLVNAAVACAILESINNITQNLIS